MIIIFKEQLKVINYENITPKQNFKLKVIIE